MKEMFIRAVLAPKPQAVSAKRPYLFVLSVTACTQITRIAEMCTGSALSDWFQSNTTITR